MKKVRPRALNNPLNQKMSSAYDVENIKATKKAQDFQIVDKIIKYMQEEERF